MDFGKEENIITQLQPEQLYAEVIVPLHLNRVLTWSLLPEMAHAQPGCRVQVQLKKGRHYAGIIKSITTTKPGGNYDVKPVIALIDDTPILFAPQLQLWQWMADYYCCSMGEVMQAALPSHLKLTSESIVHVNELFEADPSSFNEKEYLVAEALEIRKQLSIKEIEQLTDLRQVYPLVKSLVEKGAASISEKLEDKYKPKVETYISLSPAYQSEEALQALINEWSKAPKQLDLLLGFLHFSRTEGSVNKSALLKKTGASQAALQALVSKDILQLTKREVDRIPRLPKVLQLNFELSKSQEAALKEVKSVFAKKDVCLLHGITGSGKTMIYISLLAEIIQQGKQALLLVPEIALTSQLIRRLQQYLGGHVGVYHSKFNSQERIELWNKTKTGELTVVVGARSALFLPFHHLALIVVDEEHDSSYKQYDPAPRYHARDAAIQYATQLQSKVLLGSATPSLESYFNAKEEKYGLVKIANRFGEANLPEMVIIDTALATQKTTKSNGVEILPPSMIKPQAQEAIAAALANSKQVLVFQNRRGYNPMHTCQSCGWVPKCHHCDVSLTFHKSTQKLHCHYCGTLYAQVRQCERCGSTEIKALHYGTEQLEELLTDLFPQAKVARMDTDSVKGKHAHEQIIRQFEQKQIDILVGTQMIVKGLDFDDVALVCIPDTDAILNFADFRVNERAFQLIEQVSGRSGRKGDKGQVVMQLKQTQHQLLPFLLNHDYEAFYEAEIAGRKEFNYPPFTRIIRLQCRHSSHDIAWNAMDKIGGWLRTRYNDYLSGPAEPGINRIRNQYITECQLRLPRNAQLLQEAKQNIIKCMLALVTQPDFKRVRVLIDVDAY